MRGYFETITNYGLEVLPWIFPFTFKPLTVHIIRLVSTLPLFFKTFWALTYNHISSINIIVILDNNTLMIKKMPP
jgi:hypothetical protein